MFRFRDLPIRVKVTLLTVLSSGGALVLACAAFLIYDSWTFRETMRQKISAQAHIIAANSAASLLFGDPRSAAETLAALSADPAVISGGIYGRDGQLFASYIREPLPPTAETAVPKFPGQTDEHHSFEASHVDLFYPVIFQKQTMGVVAIRTDLVAMRERQLRYFFIAVGVLFISTLGAIGISLWFQRGISRPLLELAATAKQVSENNDFSLRAKLDGGGEIGQLVQTFNEMLARIQEQNQELQRAHDELEQRVAERTTQLEAANKELEAFSYSVSHDLRAPLRSIDGFSQALFEDYGDKLDDQGRSDLQRVRGATQRMAQLIDDMLNLSRVTRGEMRREKVDLSAIVKSIAAELRAAEPDRRVEIEIAERVAAEGDTRLIRVLVENLLRNAWKFTGKHATAKIEFGISQNNGKPVYFVRDDGAGFDMAYGSKLFGAFQRLHAMNEFTGTGIGLATVQRIVHRHGGKVWAEGKVDQGATFYFTL